MALLYLKIFSLYVVKSMRAYVVYSFMAFFNNR